MIRGLAVLLFFQLLGESIVFLTGLAVPGPVIGLVLLFLAMLLWKRSGRGSMAPVEQAADTLLANLGLFFVPAGVGVVAIWDIIGNQSLPIAVVLVVSAAFTLAITVWTFIITRRLVSREQPKP